MAWEGIELGASSSINATISLHYSHCTIVPYIVNSQLSIYMLVSLMDLAKFCAAAIYN